MHASHESIYTAIYAYPRGELRRQPIDCCAKAIVHAARVQQALIDAVRFQTWSLSMFAHPRSMIA